ncbi:MAG TPA: choice-of-anchor D domain-containing protein, partial [Candidatus Kapabacteria bacterium]|nr:choice-of-anchor D domain-containing protein [Candidatus Kapabacteria bacterium]
MIISSRFSRTCALVTLLLAICATTAHAQWQKIAPPVETRTVPSDGSRVTFNFALPNGMQYWVRTSGTIIMSSGGDIADAHYYNTTPTAFGYTGFMVRNMATDMLMQITSPQSYRADHVYIDPIPSSGASLSFRLSDENPFQPQTNYYLDNVGSLNVDVAQWTPELIIQHDTLDFGQITLGSPVSMLDSIQAYGKDPLAISDVYIQPMTGGNVFSFTSERGKTFTLSETTNEFKVTVTPTARGPLLAAMHLLAPNAYGSKDRIIILKAEVLSSDVRMVGNNDTLDFGTIAEGASITRARPFYNAGDIATSITNVTISTPGIFTATTPVNLPPKTQVNLNYTFNPPAQGDYFATADVQYADGGSKRMYLKGRAGVGKPTLSTRLIDFGRVLIGKDSLIGGLVLGNAGDVEYTLMSVTIDNNQFSFTGFGQNVKVGPNASISYVVRFAPTFHLDPYHEGRMVFTFDNGVQETVILRGRDMSPLSALLRIDSNYYARPGDEVKVTQ